MLTINRLVLRGLFYWVTWLYIFLNVSIAWFPRYSFFLLSLRDFWVVLFLAYLLILKRIGVLVVIFFFILLSTFALVDLGDSKNISIYLYGIRNLLFIFLICELLLADTANVVSLKEIRYLFVFILTIASLEFIISNVLNISFMNDAFKLDFYFENKGISSNLGGGVFGDRISLPLYSPALVCTFLILFTFVIQEHTSKVIAIFSAVISFFTLSKVFFIALIFFLFKKNWKVVIIGGLLLLPLLSYLIKLYLDVAEKGFLTRHLSSVNTHLHSFNLFTENAFNDIYPKVIGFSSTAYSSLSQSDSHGLESLIFFISTDLGVYSIILFIYLVVVYNSLSHKLLKKIFIFFGVVSLFSSLSNQPIAFIAAIFYAKKIVSRNYILRSRAIV